MKKLLLLLFSVIVLSNVIYGQQKKVTGKVTDAADNRPLPGVTVTVKGGGPSTQTAANGTFSIDVGQQQVLRFTYLGYETQELSPGERSVLDISLKEDTEALQEVVVTALGIERNKRSLSYSVQTLSSEDVAQTNQSNLLNALQGQIAGAQISSSGGSPGLPTELILRGSTTLSGDNQPLFIVDGIRVDNSSSGGTVNRLADFNTADIESISVLKGTAASALYGIDAASGAVIITTKSGKVGVLQINGSYKSFVESMGRTAKQQQIYTLGTGGVFDESTTSSWGRKFRFDEPIYNNMERFYQTAITHDVNMNINGGSEYLKYYVSGAYRNAGSMVPNTKQERINFLVKGTAKLSSKMDFTASANYIKNDIQEGLGGSSSGGWVNSILTYPLMYDILEYQKPNGEPIYSYLESNGNLVNGRISPMWGVMRNPRNNDTERIVVNSYLTYKALDWLNLSYRLGQDLGFGKTRYITTPGTPGASSFEGRVSETNSKNTYITSIFNATANKQFSDNFRATLILGTNSDYYERTSLGFSSEKLLVEDIFSPNVVDRMNTSLTEGLTRRQRYAVYGDLSLEFKNMLTIGMTGRNDWTSTLAPENRSFFTPSYLASFIFSELFEDKSWFGKLRASYASVGKDAPIYATNTNLVASNTVGGGFVVAARGGNPGLRPEQTSEFEIGTELSFFRRRFNVDVAYYQRKSIDQIMTPRVPLPAGSVEMVINAGSLRNRGFEFSLSGTPIKNDNFTWVSTLNGWRNQSKMLEFPGDIITFKYTNAQLNAGIAATTLGEPVLGIVGTDYKRNEEGYVIVNSSGYPIIDDIEKYIGNREPEFNLGFINSFQYKGFNLSFLWDFRFGGDVLNASRQRMMSVGTAYDIGEWRDKEFVFNGVVQQSDGTYMKNEKQVVMDYTYFATNYYQVGTNFVEKVNWARMRYLTLSYELPKAWYTNIGIKRLAIEGSVQNPFIISNYSGGDPEVNSAGPNAGGTGASTMGVDNGAIPLPKTVSFGLNIVL